MKSVTIARNYAEALFAAGDEFGGVLDAVSGAIQADERIAITLDSPRVSKAAKAKILERALEGEVPPEFVRFLQAVVRRGRQGLLPEIAQEYQVVQVIVLGSTRIFEKGGKVQAEPPIILNKLNKECGENGCGNYDFSSEIYSQIEECKKIKENKLKNNPSDNKSKNVQTHPQAIYTSRLLNFKNLPEPENSSDLSPFQNNTGNIT